MSQRLTHDQQLKYAKYRNWVKAGLGLKYLKEGLETFSNDVVLQQHTYILKEANEKGTGIRDQIILNHASTPPKPFWKNSDAGKWFSDAWSVAKCYINAPGYEKKSDATEIDCTGLLHLFINSKFLQTKIQCKITGGDVFSKVRSSRNTIFHSSSMEMEDNEVNNRIDDMIVVLEDGNELLNRNESKVAVLKLKQLKSTGFVISTHDEAQVIEDAMNELKKTIHNTEEAIKQKTEECVEAISSEFEKELTKTKKELEEFISIYSLQQTKLDYISKKKAFQKRLRELYREDLVKVSPVLLHPEKTDTVIDQLYVDPWLEVETVNEDRKKQDTKKQNRRISSYKNIFQEGDKPLKHIFVVGEAGAGKSTFCINMVNNWCIAHSEVNGNDSDNVQEMKRFDFLFYISLRLRIGTPLVETMIKDQYHDPIIGSIIEKESDSCLIVLDGLDEWTPSTQQSSTCQFQTKGLPIRNPMKDYTVITTSRPWKVESLHIKNKEINLKLLLRGVLDNSKMIENTIKSLHKMPGNKDKHVSEFQSELHECPLSEDMKHIPFVLQQLICLWFDGKLTKVTKNNIYSNMLSLFLQWAYQRNPDEHTMTGIKEKSKRLEDITLPKQLNEAKLCKDHKYFIYHAGRLAHATLFSENKESSLSFDKNTFEWLGMPDEVIQFCIKAGILLKEREITLRLSEPQHELFTFIHKSVQEFLSAIYIYVELKRKSQELFNFNVEETFNHNTQCIGEYLGSCQTINDILEQSNVIIFLAGFETNLAVHITKFLYYVSLEDDSFSVLRISRMFQYEIVYYPGLQSTISNIVEDVVQQETNVKPWFYIADILIGIGDDHPRFEFLKHVITKYVTSINVGLFSQVEESFLAFLNDAYLGASLSAIKITELMLPRNARIEDAIARLIRRCSANLKCIELVNMHRIHLPKDNCFLHSLLELLPAMPRLKSIKIDGFRLSRMMLGKLCSFIRNATYLREISLEVFAEDKSKINTSSDPLYIDLSLHHQLQLFYHNFDIIDMKNINVVNLETCHLSGLSYKTTVSVFQLLKRSRRLKHLSLEYSENSLQNRRIARHVTRLFQKWLPSLKYLTTLNLRRFQFNDNIIISPSEMKRLRKIKLDEVFMNDDACRELIDSLLSTPCNIRVQIDCCVGIPSTLWRHEGLHNVIDHRTYSFSFSTKSEDI